MSVMKISINLKKILLCVKMKQRMIKYLSVKRSPNILLRISKLTIILMNLILINPKTIRKKKNLKEMYLHSNLKNKQLSKDSHSTKTWIQSLVLSSKTISKSIFNKSEPHLNMTRNIH